VCVCIYTSQNHDAYAALNAFKTVVPNRFYGEKFIQNSEICGVTPKFVEEVLSSLEKKLFTLDFGQVPSSILTPPTCILHFFIF